MEKSFETEVLSRLAVIESKLDGYQNLQRRSEEAYTTSINNKERLDKIEDNTRWLWRTVAGILIAGIFAVVYKIGG